MADVVNVGLAPNDGTGDPLRVGMQKINAEFEVLRSKTTYIIWGYVTAYSDLPLGTTTTDPQLGHVVGVNTTTGTWVLGTQRRQGFYKRIAMTGVIAADYGTTPIAGLPIQATQAEVNIGTEDTKYLTPLTFTNSDELQGKFNYHGTVQPTLSTFDIFNNSTRTFTLLANAGYSVYINEGKYNLNNNLSIQIGTGLGQHFVYMYINAGVPTLATSQISWDILDVTAIPISIIHWDGTTGIMTDERHGHKRNLIEHDRVHNTQGASYRSGFTPTPTFTNTNTFSFAGGVINDEDLIHSLTGAQTTCRIGYRIAGVASMTFDAITTTFAKLNITLPQYENNGVLTTIANNQYGVYWIYATNRMESTKVVSIVGQAEYASIALAQAAPQPNLAGLSVAEWKLLYRVIVRRTAALPFGVLQADVLYNVSIGPAISAGAPSIVNAGNVTVTSIIGLTATNVQTSLEELNSKLSSIEGGGTAETTTFEPFSDITAIEVQTAIEQLREKITIVPTVVSGEKILSTTPLGIQLNYDTITQTVPVGTLASQNWSTGRATYTGLEGQIAYDTNYKYECIAANTWVRFLLIENNIIELYLADIDDTLGDKTSAQLDASYPNAIIGQRVWGSNNLYEKKYTNVWKKSNITTA